jgi:hypothetical protein
LGSNVRFRSSSWCLRNYRSNNPRMVLMKNNEPKVIEKEKIVAEKLNGRFAMLGFVALVGAYLTTGQIIPGFI